MVDKIVEQVMTKIISYTMAEPNDHYNIYFSITWKATSFDTNRVCSYCGGGNCDPHDVKDLVYIIQFDYFREGLDQDFIDWLTHKITISETRVYQRLRYDDELVSDGKNIITETTKFDLNDYTISGIVPDYRVLENMWGCDQIHYYCGPE